MEAALLDMTRDFAMPPMFAFTVDSALEVEIEVVDDGDYDVVVEYVFERAPIEEAFSDHWFGAHDDALAIDDEPAFVPVATPRSLHAVLGFAAAVALAACLYGATL